MRDRADFEIIDCHIHPATCQENFFRFLGDFPGEDAVFSELKSAGVSKACGSVIFKGPADDFDAIRKSNGIALDLHRKNPDFYIPGIMADPRHPAESCAEIERLRSLSGTRWIGELVGYITGYGEDYSSPGARQIYDLAGSMAMTVNIHTSDMSQLRKNAADFPKTNFVLAHPGDGRDVMKDRLAAVASAPNIFMDISGSGISRSGWLEFAIRTVGAEKLLFGTDHPICVPASYIACVMEEESVTDSQREAIFSRNFLRLTGAL